MTLKHCAICGKKEKIMVLFPERIGKAKITSKTFSARRTPDRIHHQFVKCLNCGLIFSSPVMDQKKISALYSQSTFDYSEESFYLKKTYGKYLKKILKEEKTKGTSLLDIGCGNGFFLEEAMKRGISNVYGVEPGKKAAQAASKEIKKRIKISMFDKKLFPENFFDVITCFHTLDHIIDPNSFLQTVWKNVKKNGRILFVVHDTKGLSVKLFGEKSPIFDIEHMYLFNKNSLQLLFEKNGFTHCQVFNVSNTYPLSYWVRMIPLPKMVKRITSRIFSTRVGTIPFTIPAGNIGIIAQK